MDYIQDFYPQNIQHYLSAKRCIIYVANGGLFICQMWAIGNALKTLSQLFTATAQAHLGPAHHFVPLRDDNNYGGSNVMMNITPSA